MKKRSKAASKLAKARPGKGSKPKGRNVSKPRPSPFSTDELTRLTRERDEALEQQTATSEVLQVISSSPGDLEPVFAAILEKAIRICGAEFGSLNLCEQDQFRVTAVQGVQPPVKEKLEGSLLRMAPNTCLGVCPEQERQSISPTPSRSLVFLKLRLGSRGRF
jgi:hypothetical protein